MRVIAKGLNIKIVFFFLNPNGNFWNVKSMCFLCLKINYYFVVTNQTVSLFNPSKIVHKFSSQQQLVSFATLLCQQSKNFTLTNLKVLPTNRIFFRYICIYSFACETTLKQRILAFSLILFFLFIAISTMISSVVFVYINVDLDANSTMYSFIQICAIGCVFFQLVHAYIIRRQIGDIFVIMEKIYES